MGSWAQDELSRPHLVADGVRALVDRSVATYTLLAFLPALPQIRTQLPETSIWWILLFASSLAASALALFVLALLGRSLRVAALVYAAAVAGGTVTAPLAFSPAAPESQPWMWWGVGAAVVLVGVAVDGRVAVAYGIAVGGLYGLLRSTPEMGGTDVVTAISDAVFAPAASLSVLALALGVLKAARSADLLAGRVYRRELDEAVDREVAEARAQLDRLIHDDVMTTLTALAHAADRTTTRATAELALDTITRIDDLQAGVDRAGSLTLGAFLQLAAGTVQGVSPGVDLVDLVDPADHALTLPIATAEGLLGPVREAVRNATRHAEATVIEVRWELRRGARPGRRLVITVQDDGRGFVPEAVPAARLGLSLSVRAAMEAVGGETTVASAPGAGTTVRLGCALEGPARSGAGSGTAEPESELPVSFPVDRLIAICWSMVAIGIGLGLLNLGRVSPRWPALAAMPLLCVVALVVLRRTPNLRLARGAATAAVALDVLAAVLVVVGLPTDRWPDAAVFWFLFPTQLLLAALVFRRRAAHALAGLVLLAAVLAWWASHVPDSGSEFLNAFFGPASFVVIAVAVSHILGIIAVERGRLRAQERAVIEESARRYAGLLQRALWLADLRSTTRDILAEIAGLDADVPPDLVRRALLLEAKLREAVLARHMMSDELADLTDTARRRGITVVLVDSRRSPLPREVGRTVVAEMRQALTSATVSRLVVRLDPVGRSQSASLLSDDHGETRLISIDPVGLPSEPAVADGRFDRTAPGRPLEEEVEPWQSR